MMRTCVILVVLALAPRATSATELDIQGARFTVNGRPTFLLGISYYGALGASRDLMRQDLNDMHANGFNWIRIWATWSAFENDVSAVDNAGQARAPYMEALKWLVAECDRRGMIVDVTLTRGEGRLGNIHVATMEVHLRALETLTLELKPWRNWYVDVANEHNLRSKYVSIEDARRLRDAVKKADEKRLVTISYVGDISKDDVRRYVFDAQVDFLSPHRPRNPRSPSQTQQITREYLSRMQDMGRVIPVHYQEPFRRDFSKGWQPEVQDFVTDLRGAVEGDAGGWCFHNGDNRWVDDAQPRRSFDLRTKRLFEQMDIVEQKTLKALAAAIRESH
jgi:hypothetical protein